MSGTTSGGKAAAETNMRKHGVDFYKRIGSLGGSATYKGNKGFAANRELARRVGKIGGTISRRVAKKNA